MSDTSDFREMEGTAEKLHRMAANRELYVGVSDAIGQSPAELLQKQEKQRAESGRVLEALMQSQIISQRIDAAAQKVFDDMADDLTNDKWRAYTDDEKEEKLSEHYEATLAAVKQENPNLSHKEAELEALHQMERTTEEAGPQYSDYSEAVDAFSEKMQEAQYAFSGQVFRVGHAALHNQFNPASSAALDPGQLLQESFAALPEGIAHTQKLLAEMSATKERMGETLDTGKLRELGMNMQEIQAYKEDYEALEDMIDQQEDLIAYQYDMLAFTQNHQEVIQSGNIEDITNAMLEDSPDLILRITDVNPHYYEHLEVMGAKVNEGVSSDLQIDPQNLINAMRRVEEAAAINAKLRPKLEEYPDRDAFLKEQYAGDQDATYLEGALGYFQSDELEIVTYTDDEGNEYPVSARGDATLYYTDNEGNQVNIKEPLDIAQMREQAWLGDPPKQYANEEISLKNMSNAFDRFFDGNSNEKVIESMGDVIKPEPSTSVAKTVSDTVSGWGDGITGMFKGHAEGTDPQPEEAKPDPAPDKTPAMEGRDTVRDEMTVGGFGG